MLLFVTASIAADGPVTVKRQAPAKASATAVLDQYDFGAQVHALNNGEASTIAPPVEGSTGSSAADAAAVPKDYKPKSDVPLSETARAAVRVSEGWRTQSNPPAAGLDGRVVFSYGAGLPTVVCAPLRVCMIELEAGEKLVGEPHIGDSVRWNISPALYGKGESTTSVIVLKPQTPGLDTNLLITTDRRAYYLRLVSKPDDYVARAAFAYPDSAERERKWDEHRTEEKQQIEAARIAELPRSGVDALNFRYEVKSGDQVLRPVRVFDDGAKTYIQISADARKREAPVLVVVGPDRKPEMVNYRVKGDMYIVDRLFDHAQLVIGAGKKLRKAEIKRESRN
jgi:type IV secretion system protein VirB9